MHTKIISSKSSYGNIQYGNRKLSLDMIVNNISDSHSVFKRVFKRLTKYQQKSLVHFIEDIDSLLLNNPLSKIASALDKNKDILLNKPENMVTLAKVIYLENTIMALKYLALLQHFQYDHEHLSLAYLFNQLDHTEVLTNKVIINKDLHEIKEFDGIFISNKGVSLIEIKHTLSKYSFRQIFGYLIKKKNRKKHSHLDIILDKQLCKSNKIPKINSIGIVFNRVDPTLAKKKDFGSSLKSLQNRTMLALQTDVFIEYLHEFIGEKDTRLKIKENLIEAGIKTIFFYRVSHPDIQSIFQQYNDILNKVLINHTKMFIIPKSKNTQQQNHHRKKH